MWRCRWGTLGLKPKLFRSKLCHCACTWVHKAAQQPVWDLPVEGEVHQEHKFHRAHQRNASWNQTGRAKRLVFQEGCCFNKFCPSWSQFQTWESLKYELKPSIFFSKTAWWCLCMFVLNSAIFCLRLSKLVNVFRSNEWFQNDRTGCFPLDTKHDETLGCMPQAMTQKVIDIEEIIKTDHLFHPMRDSCSGGVVLLCLKVPGIRRQTNGTFRWNMLNLVLGCSEALHLIVNLTIRRRVYFFMRYHLNCFSVDS